MELSRPRKSAAKVRKLTLESAFAILRVLEQRKQKANESDDEIGSAPDGRIIVREKKNVKEDMDMLSSDDEEGLPENIRVSDQKVARFYFLLPLKIASRSP